MTNVHRHPSIRPLPTCWPPRRIPALLTTMIISRGLSGPMTPALIHPGPVIGQLAGWMVLGGFADWRPLWNAQEGCAAARTCVIRRIDRRWGRVTHDVTIISHVVDAPPLRHFFPLRATLDILAADRRLPFALRRNRDEFQRVDLS